ncbi:MAG: lactate utilization protein [Candidatus Nomurabacteria bacterium]|nr:lactate utilization protein [Candidatus Nomurabacteria bacterium]
MEKTFDSLASVDTVNKTIESLTKNGFLPEVVATGVDALAKIKELIPASASVMNGSSRTLDEIGFVEYLKNGEHKWNNLHKVILEEKDPAKQLSLRKQSVLSDYYLGSVHSLTENGELVIASNSGSQLPHLAFTSPNIILVIGTQKITSTVDEAIKRLNEYVFPLEDARMKSVGMSGSFISKLLILNREPSFMGRKVHIVLVNEKLGF